MKRLGLKFVYTCSFVCLGSFLFSQNISSTFDYNDNNKTKTESGINSDNIINDRTLFKHNLDKRLKQVRAYKPSIDSNYITPYYTDLFPEFFIHYPGSGINVKAKDKEAYYQTNDRLDFGIGVTYTWIALRFTMNIPGINKFNEKRGNSFLFDNRFFFKNKFASSISISSHKNYFLKDYNIKDTTGIHQVSKNRDDIRTNKIMVTISYIQNGSKFSYKALFSHNQMQKKSAGSALLESYLLYNSYKALPLPLIPNFEDDAVITKSASLNYGIAAGYGHTFVIKKNWHISILTNFGIGISHGLTTEMVEEKSKNKSRLSLNSKWYFLINTGYTGNAHKVIVRFDNTSFTNELLTVNDDRQSIGFQNTTLRLIYSYRVDTKNKKGFDTLKNIVLLKWL